jgi:hypothetical protein
MRRPLLVTIAALSIVVGAAGPAAAKKGAIPARSHAHGASLLTWQQRWVGWAFGSATNPLLSGICGEQVGKLFFLNVAIEPGTEVDCQIPPGTSLFGTPAGTAAWAPSFGQTRQELLAARDSDLATISDPRATLDGRPLSLDGALSLTDVYTIPLEQGNFIQTVDPGVPGDETRVASGGWFLRIAPLTPGQHELVLSDLIAGELFDNTLHITVQKGNRK